MKPIHFLFFLTIPLLVFSYLVLYPTTPAFPIDEVVGSSDDHTDVTETDFEEEEKEEKEKKTALKSKLLKPVKLGKKEKVADKVFGEDETAYPPLEFLKAFSYIVLGVALAEGFRWLVAANKSPADEPPSQQKEVTLSEETRRAISREIVGELMGDEHLAENIAFLWHHQSMTSDLYQGNGSKESKDPPSRRESFTRVLNAEPNSRRERKAIEVLFSSGKFPASPSQSEPSSVASLLRAHSSLLTLGKNEPPLIERSAGSIPLPGNENVSRRGSYASLDSFKLRRLLLTLKPEERITIGRRRSFSA